MGLRRPERGDGRAGKAAGLEDAGDVEELCRRCEILLSICPPHAAVDVAREASGFTGIYVDANAIAPDTARDDRRRYSRGSSTAASSGRPRTSRARRASTSPAERQRRSPRSSPGRTSTPESISDEPGAASALKAAYAGWTKGSAALLLTVRELARAEGVEDALLEEWRLSIPELEERLAGAERSARRKGWRWIGEMEEIAHSMAAQDLPAGFHEAAAEVFRRTAEES